MKNSLKLLPVLMILLFACKKHKDVLSLSLANYPLHTGNTWVYQVTDSIAHTADTATFTITATYALNGSQVFTARTIMAGNVVDSGTIQVLNDSVIYLGNGTLLFSNISMLFPMSTRAKWRTSIGSFLADSTYVISADLNRTVNGRTYQHVYAVHRVTSESDLSIDQTVYISSGAGIIEQNLYSYGWVATHRSSKLISYTVY